MTIRWRTSSATSSQVWYGTSPSNLNFTTTVNGSRTDHEVKVSGLPAGTTFYYAVGNTSSQLTAPDNEHYFKTSPAPGTAVPTSIWVLGDAGKANAAQRSVRDAFYAYNGGQHADLILALGDNAYSDGTDQEYQDAWFENMYEGTLINSVLWPCPGNHDIISANSQNETGPYYDIFTLPRNGEAGGAPSGTEAYYSFDYGNIHFVSLNSEDIDHGPNSPMLAWLEQDLAANTQLWVVAILHRVIYHSSILSDFRQNFVPVLEAGGVDLVMYGHQHSYRRSYLIDGHYGSGNGSFDPNTMAIDAGDGRPDGDGAYQKPGTLTPHAGTVYMVSGSAGPVSSLPSPITFMPYEAGDPEGLGSVHISVFGGQMDVKFINYEMQMLDHFTINKQIAIGSPPTVSVTAPANGTNYSSPQAVALAANASDNGGSVTQVEFFVNNSSVGVDNQAPYSINFTPPADGTYNITAVATDNDDNTTTSQVVQFTVGPVTTCVRINAGSDDAEERPTGSVNFTSGDLELVIDGDPDGQTVGLRFNDLNIPQGANIASAHLQFTVDENTNDNPCTLTISGQASDNAAAFGTQNFSISSLPRANATASWTPSDWLAVGDAGFAQQSPNIGPIIQEIVNRPGFSASSSIALIIEGIGRRTAEAYEGGASVAPELCIEWSMAPIAFDCPNIPANIGTPCDDGDNTTLNDMVGANCICAGTPTACTGIGDADGDGVCADVDCDDLDPNITHRPGDACDDGNLATINDVYDANCNCAGTLNDCAGIGDNDGDSICSDVDCDDNDPNSTTVAGGPCDDGDNTTINDVFDANCTCAGTPTACTGIGDADGDGVCANVDCDDNDPSNTNHPGVACDDGNPNTTGETIQADCSCGGGTAGAAFTCVQVNTSSDDAEEDASGSVSLTSSDLELTEDGSPQTVGMRFTGLNIPQGATITNAYLQFAVDETRNVNPCNLTVYGENADNPPTFSTFNYDISSRPRTAATVTWLPPDWLSVGEIGAGQRTPEVSSILQEIVNRPGYTSNSAIVLLIDGAGGRTAESFNGSAATAPQLCVAFTTIQYDCQNLQANIGDSCDDGDNTTIDDVIGANCNCAGTPTACTGIGDADGDGVCTGVDCDDNDPAVTSTNTNDADCDGVPTSMDCDDNDPTVGSSANDMDCDGVPSNIDCDDNDASITSTNVDDADCDGVPSSIDCDDNDPTVTSTNTNDADCDGVPTGVDCDDNDPTVTSTNANDADCDGVPTGLDCDDNDPTVTSANTNDADCDGVPSNVDCDDNDPTITTTNAGDGDCDGVPTAMDCDDTDASIGSNANDMDCDGVPSNLDCDDNDPTVTSVNTGDGDCDGVPTATDCDDSDPTVTSANTNDADCDGVPTGLDCDDNDPTVTTTNTNDADCDGVPSNVDCDDNDPTITTTNAGDGDCDGVPTAMDCDDTDASIGSSANDMDCDGVPSNLDCDDNDPTVTSVNAGDGDCDGVPTATDCDDSDPTVTSTNTNDADCDGVPTSMDCDDNDPTIGSSANDMDCDGVPTGIDCDDNDPTVTSANTNDADCDGIPTAVDCDDSDPGITTQPGDACNDGNPSTFGETIQSDCTCGGGTSTPTTACAAIAGSADDVEERASDGRVDDNSSDLELCTDGVSQFVGLRFNGLNIPQGANIVSAYIQFQADERNNDDPCNLTISGIAADNSAAFTTTDFDLSSRPRTASTAAWSPPQWLTVGDAGAAQQSPDLSAIIQEIVNRSGYTAASSIAFMIEGTGRRVAESFDGNAGGPTLCIEFFDTPPDYDCPSLSAFVGDPCDDGDNTTVDDTVDGDCDCAGTPTACTGIGDGDGDGVCFGADCDDNDPSITTQPGDACDDGNPATVNDVITANCGCAGTLNDCPGIGDDDGDGICNDVDCNDNDPSVTDRPGDPCDDGDPNTIGETIQADCTCGGGNSTPAQTCAQVSADDDDAEEDAGGSMDMNSSDLELTADPRFGVQTIGMRFNGLNIPQGAVITSAYVQFTVDEAVNDNPCNLNIYGQAADNAVMFANAPFDISSRPKTSASVAWSPQEWVAVGDALAAQQTPDLSALIQEIVSRNGYTSASSIAIIIDGVGRRTAESFNGSATDAPELCVEYLYAQQASNEQGAIGSDGGQNAAYSPFSTGNKVPVDHSETLGPISIHPNPASSRLIVSFNSKAEGYVNVQARDLSGKTVLKGQREIINGENRITLENLSLPGGVYFLLLRTESSVGTAKFIIQKE